MGREVKRVPINFDWTIGKIWYGYLVRKCMDGDYGMACDDCRKFAKLKSLEFTNYNCPIFEELEPPVGEGWQMWETTSEGSPISPVFETPEELAQWLADNNASSFGSCTATYEQWLKMIKDSGWAMSAVLMNGEVKSGVEAVGEFNKG